MDPLPKTNQLHGPQQTTIPQASARTSAINYNIRLARPSDALTIVTFGKSVFVQSFSHAIGPQDLQTYLDEFYTHEAFQRDLNDSTKHFWVAEAVSDPASVSDDHDDAEPTAQDASSAADPVGSSKGSTIVGYIQLHTDTTEPCLGPIQDKMIEINRLYLHPSTHGTGLAQRLMAVGHEWAQERGYEKAWLGVWEHNAKAKRFYGKLGYAYVGEHFFKMGEQVDRDEIWLRELR